MLEIRGGKGKKMWQQHGEGMYLFIYLLAAGGMCCCLNTFFSSQS